MVSTYLPSLYIPDRPLELYAAPIRYLAIKDGHVASRSVRGAESITSPNYVTGAAAALLTMVRLRLLFRNLQSFMLDGSVFD